MSKGQILRTPLGAVISNYTRSYELEKEISSYDHVYHKAIPHAGFKVKYSGSPSFVTYNKDYNDFARLFPYHDIKDMKINKASRMNKYDLTEIKSYRPIQKEILNAFDNTKYKNRSFFINLQTAVGKTILGTKIAADLKLKTWIFCYSTDILSQWIKTYEDFTNIDTSRILRVSDGNTIEKMLSGEINTDDYDIFLSTPGLLTLYADTLNDFKVLYDLFNICGIGLTIYDEAHRNMSNLVKLSGSTNAKYQLFLSADYGQGERERDILFKKIFRNTVILTGSEESVNSLKYTKLAIMEYDSKPTPIEELSVFNKYGYNESNYTAYQIKKGVMIDSIEYLLNLIYLQENKYRVLILLSTISGVDAVYDRVTDFIKEKHLPISVGRYYQSINKEEKEWVKSDADIIVSTYKSFSTGIDVSNIKYVLSTNQCNKLTDNQSAGRARPLSDGTSAIYFMFIDRGIGYCKKKLKGRIEYLMQTKSSSEKVFTYKYN